LAVQLKVADPTPASLPLVWSMTVCPALVCAQWFAPWAAWQVPVWCPKMAPEPWPLLPVAPSAASLFALLQPLPRVESSWQASLIRPALPIWH